jgi:hypothetical protein
MILSKREDGSFARRDSSGAALELGTGGSYAERVRSSETRSLDLDPPDPVVYDRGGSRVRAQGNDDATLARPLDPWNVGIADHAAARA